MIFFFKKNESVVAIHCMFFVGNLSLHLIQLEVNSFHKTVTLQLVKLLCKSKFNFSRQTVEIR